MGDGLAKNARKYMIHLYTGNATGSKLVKRKLRYSLFRYLLQMQLADHTDVAKFQVFGDQGTDMVGMTADELMTLRVSLVRYVAQQEYR